MTVVDQATIGKKKPSNKWLVLAAIMLGSFITPLDSSIVNTILPAITASFHTDISIVQWVPIVYLLAISCLIMLYGRLGDMIGHKRVFLFGIAAFTVTSILCGSSQNIWMLISFRILQGLSASMILAVSFALVVATFPATERGKALGIYATVANTALAMGPTLGGLIAEHISWRYIFFINIPIGIAALLWGSRVIPRGGTKPGQRLDFPGALAAFVFLPALLLYFNRGEEWGWASPVSLMLLIAAIVFGVLFFWIERISKQPMLQLKLFTNRVFIFATVSYFLCNVAVMTFIFLTPFYMKFVLDYSIFKVGLVMAAYPLIGMAIAPWVGTASDRFGTRVFAVSGLCIGALGFFLFSDLKESAVVFNVVLCLLITGIGFALFGTPNNSTIMGSVPPEYLGITSGVITAMRYVGMVFGIAIAGAILYSMAPVATSTDPGSFTPADIGEFMNGIHWAYIGGAFASAIGAVSAVFAIHRHR